MESLLCLKQRASLHVEHPMRQFGPDANLSDGRPTRPQRLLFQAEDLNPSVLPEVMVEGKGS